MKAIVLCVWIWLCAGGSLLLAQQSFSVDLVPATLSGTPAIHSCAVGMFNEEWIFIGGRNNGLHGFLPPLAFPSSGVNRDIWVVNPYTNQTWNATADSLPVHLREPLLSSNMQFHQRGTTLYIMGGYGWKDSVANFITFPVLTAVNLPDLITEVKAGAVTSAPFRQLQDSIFAVCGAHLGLIDSVFHLVWGHRFDGRYNRLDTLGFFVQEYTYEVRRFEIEDDGTSLFIADYKTSRDTAAYRRRDYNLVPQIFPDGNFGYTGFTGVFREGINLPYLSVADIGAGFDSVATGFEQLLSQYHSAVMPVYDSVSNYMHSLFFGGMSQFFIDSVSGLVQEDTLVPFVRTISRVTRGPSGALSEWALPVRLPQLMGSNAFFLPDIYAPFLHGSVLHLNALTGRTRAGWLFGGMTSPLPNISDTDPSLSWATPEIFEVWIDSLGAVSAEPREAVAPFTCTLSPNPASEELCVSIEAVAADELALSIISVEGKEMAFSKKWVAETGNSQFRLDIKNLAPGRYYLRLSGKRYTQALPFVKQ